jgi:hypothetical protein
VKKFNPRNEVSSGYLAQRANPTAEMLYQRWTAGCPYGLSANPSAKVVPLIRMLPTGLIP